MHDEFNFKNLKTPNETSHAFFYKISRKTSLVSLHIMPQIIASIIADKKCQ